MRTIEIGGYRKPQKISAGPYPVLEWLSISDLVIDPSYRPPVRRAKRTAEHIARSFSWTRFGTIIVAPSDGDKFVIIDGERRTTAAALLGFEKVPCMIVSASREQQAIAFKAINGPTRGNSRLAKHAAGIMARDPGSVRLAEACASAGVELLSYPVSTERQSAGQTMAIGAISSCLKRYGEDTLIAALQCVTRTSNNRPGALSARIIRALCAVLAGDPALRDSGAALLRLFDRIDLMALANESAAEATSEKSNPVQVLIDRLRRETSKTSHR